MSYQLENTDTRFLPVFFVLASACSMPVEREMARTSTASQSTSSEQQIDEAPDQAISLQTNEETALVIDLRPFEKNAAPVAITIAELPEHGKLVNAGEHEMTYLPNPNYHGADALALWLKAGKGDDLRLTKLKVAIKVLPTNDPPTAMSLALAVSGIDPVAGQLLAVDPESNELNFSLLAKPRFGEVSVEARGRFTYTPPPLNSARSVFDSFSFSVKDPEGLKSEGSVTIDLRTANDAPLAFAAEVETLEDEPVSGRLMASDVQSLSLRYSVTQSTKHGRLEVDELRGTYLFHPEANYSGHDEFIFRVFDGELYSKDARIKIKINSVNDAPILQAVAALTLNEDNTKAVPEFKATDVDSANLSFVIVAQPAHGTLEGSMTFPMLRPFLSQYTLLELSNLRPAPHILVHVTHPERLNVGVTMRTVNSALATR